MLSFEDRQKEIKRLQEEHKSVLCTPLMSEGSISPFQVGLMSDNQRKKWQADAQKRLQIESRIRLLNRNDDEIKAEEKRESDKKTSGRILQINSLISTMERFKGKNGNTLPKYQREINKLLEEKKRLTG